MRALPLHGQFEIFPVGERSKKNYYLKQHALIGVSPFNSYFTEPNLIKLINWAFNNFKEITVFLPDKISAFTLMALGYSPTRAASKTRQQDNYLKNKVFRAFRQLGFNEINTSKLIITLTQLSSNANYQKIYNDCLIKFEEDIDFKKGCRSTSSWILANNPRIKTLTEEELDCAVKYFLHELPLFLDTPLILNVESSLFVYHFVPTFLEMLHSNNKLVSPHQGFLKVIPNNTEKLII